MPSLQEQMSTDLLENRVPRDSHVTQNLIPIFVPYWFPSLLCFSMENAKLK
jgi:hypothetical protein